MLTFIAKSPSIRHMLSDAKYYVASRIGTRPRGFGYGAELFNLAGTGAARLINRYKNISNWTVYSTIKDAGIAYWKDFNDYENDPGEQNKAMAVFNDIVGILDVEWKKPDDPIQSVIGKVGFFSDSGKQFHQNIPAIGFS